MNHWPERSWLAGAAQAAAARCGVTVVVVARQQLSPVHIARFAVTCGYPPPAGVPATGLPAPPLYLAAMFGWGTGPADAELRPDGLAAVDAIGVDLAGGEVLGAGQTVEATRDAVAGEPVTVTRTIEQVTCKQGRSGEFLLVRVRREISGEDGPICTCRESFVVRERS